MARYRGMSGDQRKAYFAKMKKASPVKSRFTDLLGSYFGGQIGARGVRRFITEPQYSSGERAIRRGKFGDRVVDTLKQSVATSVGGGIGAVAGGIAGGSPGLMLGQAVGGLAGFGAARVHVNKLRNQRLLKKGGQVRSWLGKVKKVRRVNGED